MIRNRITAAALLLITAFSLTLTFVSCKESDPYADLELDVEQVALDLRDNGKFIDDLERLDDATVPYIYGFDDADKIVVYAASGATPEEIIVAEYSDPTARSAALEKLDDRLAAQRKTFDSYKPEYRPLLDSPLLVELGKYLIYCVSDDYDASEAVISHYIESET